MDTCVRNLSLVQHLAAFNIKESRTEVSDMGRFRAGLADSFEEEVFCPKPQRKTLISYCPHELVKPIRQWQSPSPHIPECEGGSEILEIFLNKNGGESPSFGCSPPYSLGSPPSRAGNPIVHDVQFCHQRSPPMALMDQKTLNEPTLPASPSVRIEGFDCSKQGSRLRVPSIA